MFETSKWVAVESGSQRIMDHDHNRGWIMVAIESRSQVSTESYSRVSDKVSK